MSIGRYSFDQVRAFTAHWATSPLGGVDDVDQVDQLSRLRLDLVDHRIGRRVEAGTDAPESQRPLDLHVRDPGRPGQARRGPPRLPRRNRRASRFRRGRSPPPLCGSACPRAGPWPRGAILGVGGQGLGERDPGPRVFDRLLGRGLEFGGAPVGGVRAPLGVDDAVLGTLRAPPGVSDLDPVGVELSLEIRNPHLVEPQRGLEIRNGGRVPAASTARSRHSA